MNIKIHITKELLKILFLIIMLNANNYKEQKLRGLKRKYEIIIQRGGKCEICGYDKNLSAFEFHHINPEKKSFQIDMRHFSNTNLETLRSELNKCMMLCANCHREIHHQDLILSEIPIIIEHCDKESFNNPTGSICPVCNQRFPKAKGKIYCYKECREKSKNYPTKQEVLEQYEELKSWNKVSEHFNLTRKIIQGIRNKK